ncbi:MAG: BamA/TamA family outer membrane protein, partial [Succinivibrionaceae bacterium]|nr:BamA/TamA family outer membrane protein [Succinivibrionaceae bacterium]
SVSGVTQAANFSYYIPRENPIDDYYRLSAEYRHKDLNDTEFQNLTVGAHYFTKTHGRWQRDYFIESSFEDYDQSDDSDDVFLLMPGAEISRLTTDGTTDPASGERIRLSARFSSKTLLSSEDFVILDAFYRRIWSPTDGSRLVIRAEQGAILGSSIGDVPSSLRFFAGGDQSVRGFGYEKISPKNDDGDLTGARYLSVGSVELQVPVMNKVRMAIFTDVGTATNDYGDDTDIKVGTGLGVRYISPVGPIRADIGVGVSETHIPIRLHFGLGLDL